MNTWRFPFGRGFHPSITLVLLGVLLVIPIVFAGQPGEPAVQCTPTFSDCAIPENVALQFPFLAISGDVAVAPSVHADLNAVRDVFRINNNFIDTGAGTGIGFTGALFSGEHVVPAVSSYSANAVEIRENPQGHGDTLYFGNGTNYHLETGVLSNGGSSRSSKRAPNAALDLVDGPMAISTAMGAAFGPGPEQDPGQEDGLAFYSANYTSLGGKQLPFQIVGTDPSQGAATTTVPTVIVPVRVVYQLAANTTLDGSNVLPAVQNSPIFLNADYTVGGTDVGVTQFGDALQRAEFFNLPGFSPNYHVLLGTPTIASTLTVTVTKASDGTLLHLRNGGLAGIVRSGFFDLRVSAAARAFPSNTLVVFLTDNVFESFDGTVATCCVLGYHNSQGPPASSAKTWIYNAYAEPGTFSDDVIVDVQTLSHEVAEWLNDPFVGALSLGFLNLVPPALLPGQDGTCIINFETGDPLESPPAVFTKVTNGTTYHLQDEVFLPWYLHATPSFSVNGWFTLQNTFTSFSSLCHPG